ncbi:MULTISPECIES: hypothetical protein [Dickeya]|uniref:hypothetical protein n=1 Tax=Dickeya TaxID=204037 RepID=UPI0003A6EB37|nr:MULTISPECIES: hypothetical protein [Dickeya]MBO8134302.1 hypothetical protein [Dickeya fangzhongdai]UGA51065.1 hypothetical protein QR68_21565 [Dickeya fangzhongdai]ULR31137.1 hypothetical protein MJO48_22500 [Dickeya fangzhongdai]UWH07417.1 hypothetical protein K0H75_21565 [Dickeya fangzhongdai]WES90223.1 hypothetical protein PQ617_06840 [Dickeya fangzhongdai]
MKFISDANGQTNICAKEKLADKSAIIIYVRAEYVKKHILLKLILFYLKPKSGLHHIMSIGRGDTACAACP